MSQFIEHLLIADVLLPRVRLYSPAIVGPKRDEVRISGYHITRNLVICTGHLVLLVH
jgi:hypothetical protein